MLPSFSQFNYSIQFREGNKNISSLCQQASLSFSFDSTDIQVVLACSHARRVALEAAFHAPESRAFGCPEEHPKPRGATFGGATFDHSAKKPGHDEAQDGAKASRRSDFGEPQTHGAAIDPCPAQWRRVVGEGARTKGNQTEKEQQARMAKGGPEVLREGA